MAKPKPSHNMVRINLVIPDYLKQKWDSFAQESGQTLTTLIKQSVNNAIEHHLKSEPESTLNEQLNSLRTQLQDLQNTYMKQIKEGTLSQEIENGEEQKNRILLQLEKTGSLTQKELETLVPIPKKVLSKLLIELSEDKLVEFVKGKWRLATND